MELTKVFLSDLSEGLHDDDSFLELPVTLEKIVGLPGWL